MASTRGRLLHEPMRRRQIELPPPPDVDLDASCGRYFKYRDFIECGETWHRLMALHRADPERYDYPDNVPREPETYQAIRDLCRSILDPARVSFGAVALTYGFASQRLTRRIAGRIAPSLDQHAGCEKGANARCRCRRKGLAVDLWFPSASSDLVLRWLDSRDFDRAYYYGARRPLHVSIGPGMAREIVALRPTKSHRVPTVCTSTEAIALLDSD